MSMSIPVSARIPPAPPPEPVGAGITVADLYAAAVITDPHYVTAGSDGRSVHTFWLLPDAEADRQGFADAAELSIRHDKERKRYCATLSATSIQLRNDMFSQRFSLFAARTSTQVLTAQVTRFNTARFAAFTRDVHAAIASQRGPGWGPG